MEGLEQEEFRQRGWHEEDPAVWVAQCPSGAPVVGYPHSGAFGLALRAVALLSLEHPLPRSPIS